MINDENSFFKELFFKFGSKSATHSSQNIQALRNFTQIFFPNVKNFLPHYKNFYLQDKINI